ncbi:MAG: hypothetical protein JKX70_06065 [Phycisphaerales bacterium]|nr:hypothetical protein [Phycisphaerales bacterium]
MLKLGAEVDARSNKGETALIFAAQETYGPESLVALLDAGADVQLRDHAGKTALDYVLANDFFDGTQARDRLIEASN